MWLLLYDHVWKFYVLIKKIIFQLKAARSHDPNITMQNNFTITSHLDPRLFFHWDFHENRNFKIFQIFRWPKFLSFIVYHHIAQTYFIQTCSNQIQYKAYTSCHQIRSQIRCLNLRINLQLHVPHIWTLDYFAIEISMKIETLNFFNSLGGQIF